MSQPLDLARFLETFVAEARERLDRFEQGIIALEAEPSDDAIIKDLLREAHTIKGSARMVGLAQVDSLAHRTETLLTALRDHARAVSAPVIDCLLHVTDGLRTLVDEAAGDRPVGSYDLAAALARVDSLLAEGETAAAMPTPPRPGAARRPAAVAEPALPAPVEIPEPVPAAAPARRSAPAAPSRRHPERTVRVSMRKLEQLSNLTLDLATWREVERVNLGDARVYIAEMRRIHRALGYVGSRLGALCTALREQNPVLFEEVSRLRAELGTTLSEIRATANQADASLQARAALRRRDQLLSEELQSVVAELHLVPVSTIFDTFPRAVRDIGSEYGKDVQLLVEGGDTQLDKKIVEEIGEPLLHLVRNAISHGIEPADQRRRAGKPPRGTISLTAQTVADRIHITVRDDGAGIDLDAVRRRAVERGLLTADEAALCTDQQAANLIFLPGLTTARMITDVSGRGVGMEIVESTVRRLNGTVSVDTTAAHGAAFTMDLPLTVAVMNVLMVRVAGRSFALPTSFVRQVARVKSGQLERAQGVTTLRLGDASLQVAELAAVLGLPGAGWNGAARPVLILGTAGHAVGFAVDDILSEDKVVVKSLAGCPVRLRLIMAATVGPYGEVVPILDVAGVIEASRSPQTLPDLPTAAPARPRRVLVVDDSAVTSDLERNILESAGYVVEVAADGIEALDLLGRSDFDLVVCDVEMPRLDGFSLLERLRAAELTRDLPVIMVTSRHTAEDRQRGLALGANAYIAKTTFEQSALLDTAQRLVG